MAAASVSPSAPIPIPDDLSDDLSDEEEEEQEPHEDTLFEATDFKEFIGRKVEPDDIIEIKRLLTNPEYDFFHFEDPTVLYEKCCYSIVISDAIETERIVAAAFFDDTPIDVDLKTFAKKWKTGHLENLSPMNTFYMRLFAGSKEVPVETLLTEVVGCVFISLYPIEYIVVELPEFDNKGPFQFCQLVTEHEINPSGSDVKKILLYEKDALFPPLKFREGRKYDMGDLFPMLPINQETLLKEFGKRRLVDLITLSDKHNQSLVAEWYSKAVGILTVSTDVNLQQLNEHFNLELFHGLHKTHPDDIIDTQPEVRNVSSVPIPEILQEARKVMNQLKSKSNKRRPREEHPYDVERRRDDCYAADYESDDIVHIDEKHPGHQFGDRVSQDIITYGLREPSVASEITERASLTACMANLQEIVSHNPPPEETEYQSPEEEDEEEELENQNDMDEEEEFEDEEDRIMSPIPIPPLDSPVGVGEEGLSSPATKDGHGITRTSQEHEAEDEAEFSATGMSDFFKEAIEEHEEGQNEIDLNIEGVGLPIELNVEPVQPAEIQLQLEFEIPEEEEEEEIPLPSITETTTETTTTFAITNDEESYNEGSERRNSKLKDRDEEMEKIKAKSKGKSMNTKGKSKGGHSMTPGALVPLAKSSGSMTFFQHKFEFKKKLSDDTIFLGKMSKNKNFEEKVDLMKKVWEIYQYMKQEGLTFEAAKIYLQPSEFEILEEADALTKGNLLKFLTHLLPDEKMYPFEKPVKGKLPTYYGSPNALNMKIFNIEKKFSIRTLDYFHDIFRFFPSREYLKVTIAQGAKEPAWLEHFTRVPPREDSLNRTELFILHKAYLNSKLKVRKAKLPDIPNVIRLLKTNPDKDKILEDFKRAVCCKDLYAFVVEVKSHPSVPIVGVSVVSDEYQSQSYHINYELDRHTYYVHHREKEHAYVHHFTILPIFRRFSRTFMRQILRILDKSSVYQRMYPALCVNETTEHQSTLSNLEDWIPAMPRKRVHYSFLNLTDDAYDLERLPPAFATNYKDPYALIYFGKKFSVDPKVNINSRIVFVGASETTLACIGRMLSSSHQGYKRITVIDTYGIPGELETSSSRDEFFAVKHGGICMSFESVGEWVQRMGIRNWVTVVTGSLTKIERDKKQVVVNKEQIIPYDHLVLATGRQFQRIDCPEPEIDDPNFISFKKKFRVNRLQGEPNLNFKRDTPKPKNVFVINHEVEADIALNFIKNYMPFMKKKKILIFGGGLKTYACVKALLVFGVPAKRIVLISSSEHEVEWETKSGYTLTNTVRVPMEEEFKRHGVHMVENYEFTDWDKCPISGLVKRCHFNSPNEIDYKISFSTFAVFCYRYRRVNDDMVSALSESYIIYQDGIVIDENFKTNDPYIYAAGPATTYKKILLAEHQDQQFYQSGEVGEKLAEVLIEETGTEGGGPAEVSSYEVIRCVRPFVRSINLLGGWHYMFMRRPGAPMIMKCSDPNNKCDVSGCECTTEIVTGSVDLKQDPKQKYFKVRLDDQSRIAGIECMSKTPFSASNFMGMFGQHEVILNKMMERLEKGETKDLFDHFCQPWYGVFAIGHWEDFTKDLQTLYKTYDIGDNRQITDLIRDFITSLSNPDSIHVDPNIIRSVWDSSKLKQEVELKFLAFLKFHRFSLPMYARNDYVEDLLEERSTSTLYHPKIVKY